MDTKTIANNLYHGAVLSLLTVGYTMLGKKLLKIKPANLDKLDIEDTMKISVTVGGAIATQSFLVSQGILPPNIITNPTV